MMPKTASARWLAAISVVAIAVAVTSVVVTLVATQSRADPLPEGSPERVVQRYILAVEDDDFETAYALLHESVTEHCTLSEFLREVRNRFDRDFRVRLDEVYTLPDGEAEVFIEVTSFSASGPLEFSDYTSRASFLTRQSGDEWRIETIPYRFGGCPYRPPPTATPTPDTEPAALEG